MRRETRRTFNGNPSDELKGKDGRLFAKDSVELGSKSSFINSWRLGSSESLFNYKSDPDECFVQQNREFCPCDDAAESTANCSTYRFIQRASRSKREFKKWEPLFFPEPVSHVPIFQNMSTMYAFKGQPWEFLISVSDSDGQTLKLEIIGNSYGMEISSAGVLLWFPVEYNKTFNFTVKATDPCGSSTQHTFTVVTKACVCEAENGGYCVWVNNDTLYGKESVCKCPEGCTGSKCKDAMPGKVCDMHDPCVGYVTTNSERRGIDYVVSQKNPSLQCDSTLTAAWYRFKGRAGEMMANSCPPEGACGSKGSAWLQGDIPIHFNQEKVLKTCVRIAEECCANGGWDVEVKKCSKNGEEYFVYHLPPTPECPMRYCAGKENPCPLGEGSLTGYTPGCNTNHPKLKKNPAVSIDFKNCELRFKCEIEPEETVEDIRHEVTWYESPQKLLNVTALLKGDLTETFFETNNRNGAPTFCYGKKIYCKVRSYYESKLKIDGSVIRKSNELLSGFMIDPLSIELPENAEAVKITIMATIPIICKDPDKDCEVRLNIRLSNDDVAINSADTIVFKQGPAGQVVEIQVAAKRDFVDDGDKKVAITFEPVLVNVLECNCYNIEELKKTSVNVVTRDIPTGICRSVTDPQITTFDGTSYLHFNVGDYVMVNSTSREFEVHARTNRCSSVSCNCGMSAREGDEVVVIDMCRDNVPRVRFVGNSQQENGTTVLRSPSGKDFLVNFPSGAYIRFSARSTFANIYIHATSDEYRSTNGLCGLFHGSPGNDLKGKNGIMYAVPRRYQELHAYMESWRIPSGESLFYYKNKNDTNDGNHKNSQEQARRRKWYTPSRPRYLQGFKNWKRIVFQGDRDNEDAGIYDPKPDVRQPTVPSFPTASGISETKANSICRDSIETSTTGRVCLGIVQGFNITQFVKQCVLDIQVMDDVKTATESAINSMTASCEEITLREVKKYWKNDSAGIMEPPSIIANSICPNDCSGNGDCRNATCVCNKGYISSDCSMVQGEPPILRHTAFNGLCDVRKRKCSIARVVGYNFLDSNQLRCRTTKILIFETTPVKVTSKVNIGDSQLLSFAEVSCELPGVPVDIGGDIDKSPGKPTGGFYIELSNDGKIFSKNKTLFVVYDSKCMECSTDDVQDQRTCKLKANSCKMNNYCFANGDANPKDWCEVCDPVKSNSTFVKRQNNIPPIFKSQPILNAFKSQRWRYEIPVRDPEKFPLAYKFIGDSHGMEISSAGVLTWFPTEYNKTYEITVHAIDICGESAQQSFEVVTRMCNCKVQNKICVLMNITGNETVVCQCPEGCSGPQCDEPIDGETCQKRKAEQPEDGGQFFHTTFLVVACAVAALVLLFAAFVIYKACVAKNTRKYKAALEKSSDTALDVEMESRNMVNEVNEEFTDEI